MSGNGAECGRSPWMFRVCGAICLLMVIAARGFNVDGGFYPCLCFWACSFVSGIPQLIDRKVTEAVRLLRWGTVLGAAMNAAVMLSNEGHMPVFGMAKQEGLWRPVRETTDNLLVFSDRFGGCSIGDFLIFGFAIAALVVSKGQERPALVAPFPTVNCSEPVLMYPVAADPPAMAIVAEVTEQVPLQEEQKRPGYPAAYPEAYK